MTERKRGDGSTRVSGSAIDRRSFLRGSAAFGLGLLPFGASGAEPTKPEGGVARYATLGRTGLRVPDIGMGCFKLNLSNAQLVHEARHRGITHFDTADSYQKGRSEDALGRALAGHRQKMTLTSKHRAESGEKLVSQMAALEASLKRLRTDYIDIYLNHAVNDLDRIQDSDWPEFVSRAKAEGKIRFAGISGHGGRLTDCLGYALDNDLVDVILVAYAFAQDPGFLQTLKLNLAGKSDMIAVKASLPGLLERARSKGVGVMAMKTLFGARLNDMRPYEGPETTFAQSAFRWVLSSSHVDSLVVTMKSTAMMDEYLVASGAGPVSQEGLSLLRDYHDRNGASQCRYGCSACADVCPAEVPITDVLRSRMYAMDYEDRAQADSAYGKLAVSGSPCLTCSGAPCASACPYGIEISSLTRETHQLLGPGGAPA
jgi:predicted aldo/keto reductase-like oxidoreductase